MNSISVVFEDQNIVVVNKPPGLSVHNVEEEPNLLQLLEKHLNVPKLFPVHRLDKETSGVQVLALNSLHAKILAEQFQARATKKIYHGILRGKLKTEVGVWNQPLTDKAEGRKNPQGLEKNRVACDTRFKVVASNSYFTMCEFHLITGRQHQIRKHAALAKHALVGDSRYNDTAYNAKISKIYSTERLFLHCSHLSLLDYAFSCELPGEFATLISSQQQT